MASTNDATAPNTNSIPGALPQSSPSRARGGRGRGRGGNQRQNNDDREPGKQGEARGGARGRGGHRGGHNRNSSNPNTMSAADLAARYARNAPKPSTDVPTLAASVQPTKMEDGAPAEEEVEAEVCFICASPVVHNSVAPCNHRTCHICALRMRALYKTKDCAHCRAEAPYVIFTDDASKRYEDFTAEDLVSTDENIGIRYEKSDILEDTLLLLRYNCPEESCEVACLGWPDLHRHVRSAHHKKMCDLCSRNKKVFTHEHDLFTDKELERHMKKGDDNPGAIDQSGFKGHPLCGFCGQRFYGDDELYVHCRAKHERCFICDRREGFQPQYFLNYETLEHHFKEKHFICSVQECLDKKFVVFGSEIDLKAHQLSDHGNTLSKDVRRDARVVDISSFDYRAPYVQERRGGSQREQREGRGRGRDPNTDAVPASSAQPLRRDEQAFQRQMAIHSAQSVSNRTFGGQLTAAQPAPRAPPAASQTPRASEAAALTSTVESASISDDQTLSSQERARRLRHAAVIERASTLLQNETLKLSQFRNAISSYRTNAISAGGLIDSFFALFSDTSSTALGSLVREVADLYEDKTKSEQLRTAWNDWRAINEDYPSLPGPSGLGANALPQGWAQVTAATPSAAPVAPKANSSRVLKLKSSTAQSSRSSVSRQGSWGSNGSSPAGQSFPGLPATTSLNNNNASSSSSASVFNPNRPLPGKASTPWLNATASPHSNSHANSASNSGRNTPSIIQARPRNGGATGDMFPALPPAAKPTSTIFGYGTGMVRRDFGGSSSAASYQWGGGSGPGSGNASAAASDSEAAASGKKKGNKGKKVLVQWG